LQGCDDNFYVDFYNEMEYNTLMLNANRFTDPALLKQELKVLLLQRIKLDQFFDRYLEMFEMKMKPEKSDTAIWKLYKKKYKEYDDICARIQTAEHFLKRTTNV